jgi:glycerol-3-phosphate O-acyltransferase / dihydroxyacetone phosphate acyltransferase
VAYRLLAWLLRVATRVFFRQIEIVGLEHVPHDGPVIFAGNHPNSLIDPVLIITTCGRKVHFAAKDSLFSGRIMRAILRGLGAVPIKRREDRDGDAAAKPDGGATPVDNHSAFAAMFDVLGRGDAIGIFPEGLSHDESQLSRLKTGAARLALGAAHQTARPIAIVPCGLTFIHPKRFRSRVLVQYGPPLTITTAIADTPDEVRTVTDEIGAGLRRLTVNAPDWETVRALDVVRRLYQPQEISIEERVELARRFNTYYGDVAANPRVAALMLRVRAYQERLDDVGVSDRELARDLSKLEVFARVIRQVMLIAFWLPLTIPGAPLHLPPLIFARLASGRLTPRKDVIATTKLVIGLMIVVLAYAVAIALLWWKRDVWWAVVAAVILPLSGWATLRVLDRVRLVRRGVGVLVRRLRFRVEVASLRAERAQLVIDVIATVTAIKPLNVEPMFPPDRTEESSKARRNADLDDVYDKRDHDGEDLP